MGCRPRCGWATLIVSTFNISSQTAAGGWHRGFLLVEDKGNGSKVQVVHG